MKPYSIHNKQARGARWAALAAAALSSGLVLSACAIGLDQEPIDFTTLEMSRSCGDGVAQPGEVCLEPPVRVAVASRAVRVRAVETGLFNSDSRQDLVGIASGSGEGHLNARMGDGYGTFPWWFNSTDSDTEFTDLAIYDMNGDGRQDLIIASATDDVVLIRLGTADGWSAPTVLPVGNRPIRIQAGDLDGNGLGDFVSLDSGSNSFGVVLQLAPGYYAPPTTYFAQRAQNFSLADCDGDGALDLLYPVEAGLSARVQARPNSGTGAFGFPHTSGLSVPDGSETLGIATADLNGDGTLDVVVTSENAWTTALVGDGGCSFTPTSTNQTYARSFRPELADINGDGHADLIAPHGNATNNSISIKYGDGTGALSALYGVHESDLLNGVYETSAVDLNEDGALDLVIASGWGIYVMLSAP